MKSQIISLIIPLNLCIFLVVLGAIFLLLRWRRLGLSTMAAGLLWLLFWSLPITSIVLGGYLEKEYPYQTPNKYPVADAIVVFGSSTANNRNNWFEPYDQSKRHARIDTADDLYFLNKAPLIILSGAALEGNVSEAYGMAFSLRNRGIPKEALIIENKSTTTRENGVYVKELLDQHHIQSVLLVTSSLHMPRAMAVMHRLGVNPIAAPNPPQIIVAQGSGLNIYIPNARALEASRSIIKEYLGVMTYWLRGWV